MFVSIKETFEEHGKDLEEEKNIKFLINSWNRQKCARVAKMRQLFIKKMSAYFSATSYFCNGWRIFTTLVHFHHPGAFSPNFIII